MTDDDPFRLLGLPPDCDDSATIRAAYHALVRRGAADATVNSAYARIRHDRERQRYRWQQVTALVGRLPADDGTDEPPPQLDAVIHEVISLNDWELGEPA